MKNKHTSNLRWIRSLLLFFMVTLFLSGVTAIPIDAELTFLLHFFPGDTLIHQWLLNVLLAYRETARDHSFLMYGYDWLAFAHLILTILFIGPYRDPLRNIWVMQFGLIACLLIIPLALIAGPLRGIPLGWRLIDCSFGVFGFIPLWICYTKTKQLLNEFNYPHQ